MDDHTITTKSLALYGCKLAKELESNIDNAFCKAEEGAKLCDELAKIFGRAAERLRGGHDQAMHARINDHMSNLHQWLANSNSVIAQGSTDQVVNQPVSTSQGMDWLVSVATSNTNACSSSTSKRSQRRRDEAETRIVKMAAPQIGNTEIPPDDGYTWRKYGQKEIMGKMHPRGYYRCTHQKQFNCLAKKQVQRDDRDPFTFEVMYRGHHTCHLSSTAPSMLPPPSHDTNMPHTTIASVAPYPSSTSSSSTTAALRSWLSIHAGGPTSGGGSVLDLPVVDMADAMFNSGSSSSNSMDFLFPSAEDNHKLLQLDNHIANNKKNNMADH